MYPKNLATPPKLFATVVAAADGTPITSGVAAKYSTGAGSQAAGGGTCQYEGNGQWSYLPTQAETNVLAFGIQFYHASAVGTGPTVSVVTTVVNANALQKVSLNDILATALTETSEGYLTAAFKKLFDVATPLLVASDVMRGTDSAALASAWTSQRAGYVDKLNVSGTLAHSDAAATYKATGFSTHSAADVVTALGTGATLTACATATGFSTHAAADVAALVLATPAQKLVTDANGYVTYANAAPPAAGTIADAVWDEAIADHATGTTFGGKNQKVVPSETIGDYKATGFSTFNPASDKVYLADGAHGGETASITLADYGDFQGGAGSAPTAEEIRAEIDSNSTQLAAIVEDTGTTLPAAIAGLATLSGEGAYTGTLTINDGSTGLEGVVVNATRGGVLIASGATDANGQITDWVFDAQTYTLAVRLPGYQPATSSVTVSGNAWTKTISLTAISITAPADPTLCTVQLRLTLSGTAVVGAIFSARLLGISQAADGTILSNAELTDTTDAFGIAELQLVQKGSILKGSGIYQITVTIAGKPVSSVQTTIPNQSVVLFEDLL